RTVPCRPNRSSRRNCRKNHIIAGPSAPSRRFHLTQGGDGAIVEIYPFQLQFREESQVLSVRRPERKAPMVDSGNRRRCQTIKTPQPPSLKAKFLAQRSPAL